MGFLIDQVGEAIGSVKSWLRPTDATPLLDSWVILDGSTIVDPDSPFNGLSLPDTRDQFLKGHPSLTNINFGADTTYQLGGAGAIPSGGTDQHALAHTHPGGAHTHSLAGHQHSIPSQVNHTHAVPAHTHPITSDGTHNHLNDAGQPAAFTRTTSLQGVSEAGDHNHGGATSNSIAGVTGSGGTHDHGALTGLGSGSSGVASGNTDSALATINNEPPWLGFLWIMKYK